MHQSLRVFLKGNIAFSPNVSDKIIEMFSDSSEFRLFGHKLIPEPEVSTFTKKSQLRFNRKKDRIKKREKIDLFPQHN